MTLLRAFWMSFVICLLTACASPSEGPDYAKNYDIYIHGGTVVDGTGRQPFKGDILVRGDTIMYVGPVSAQVVNAASTIDATGKTVTPGFIDAHAHGAPLQNNNDFMKSFLRQGVTTVILGQDGSSPGRDIALSDWLAAVESHGAGPNVAALVGHGSLRNQWGGGEKDSVTPADQARMEQMLAEAMMSGAYGLSTGLEYLPGRYADAAELNGLAKVVGRYDGLISSHIRNEDDDKVAQSVAEVIQQARFARVNITHIKVVYGKTKEQGEAVMQQIREARNRDMTVTADVYPYLASYGSLIYLYPEWAKRKSEFDDAVLNRRGELEAYLRAKIKRRNGADAILISAGDYAGKTLGEIAAINGVSPEQQIIAFGHSGPSTAHFIMTKATQDVFVTAPDVSISSDGSPTMRHPRSFGSFPKIIEDYVVRDKQITIEQAIYKMSGLTAQTFGIQSRGTLKAGLAADILIFDPVAIKANTGWSDISAQPTGFDAVIVNGHVTDIAQKSGGPVYGKVLRKTRGD
ncbi:N-acyl-D-amino-acid deacylase family protein [Robiginitomaculum antarcticum]|uniref:N-acyl-D-amino-acid deacylase family protein n=1 Tax=Robiginitomaculum antarcticum TaxID=437507 RepID=UPI00036B0120|nr:amidohydrolase family protein [Robiginitomaculum antarcticum]